MTASSSTPAADSSTAAVHRAVRIYERLLILYPREFRVRYGPDMVQLFGDLIVHAASGRAGRIWVRVVADLAVSVPRQHAAGFGGGRTPRRIGAFVAVVLAVVATVIGTPMVSGDSLLLLPVIGVGLLLLPALGVAAASGAWVTWRTTGARPGVGRALVAPACFLPGLWWLVTVDGGGYWTFVTITLALVVGLSAGALWAIVTLATRRTRTRRRTAGAVGLLVAAVVVLGSMAGAGFNSYLKSRPPPGDHSVKNASPESRALWDAADRGDLDTVIAMIDACADPFVHFDDGGRARSNAEWWAGVNHSGRDPVEEPRLSRYLLIVDHLKAAEASWTLRCNTPRG